MKNLQDYLSESILGDLGADLDKEATKFELEKIFTGDYKYRVYKDGSIGVTGNITLRDYDEDTIPQVVFRKIDGNLNIVDCPNIRNIIGLFDEKKGEITRTFSVTSCKSFDSLDGVPEKVRDVTLVDLPQLRTLDGMPKDVHRVQLLKLKKRWKEEDVRKYAKNAVEIMCSEEDKPAIVE